MEALQVGWRPNHDIICIMIRGLPHITYDDLHVNCVGPNTGDAHPAVLDSWVSPAHRIVTVPGRRTGR